MNELKTTPKTALWPSYELLERIAKQDHSAFYLLDADKLRRNYLELEQAFSSRYPKIRIAYSFKTNYTPFIVNCFKQMGAWAEVVSEMEYDIARVHVGYDADQIVVNGPIHQPAFIERVLLEGALFNVDAWYLLEQVEAVCKRNPGHQFRIGIRITYAIEEGGFSRFGIAWNIENIERLQTWLQKVPNCSIEGFHSHYSNSSRSLVSFSSRIQGLLAASKAFFSDMSPGFINVGGGFFGNMPESLAQQYPQPVPDVDDYAQCLTSAIKAEYSPDDLPAMLLEPGTALVANAMVFVCRVYEVRRQGDKWLALVNGSNHNINHKWQGEKLPVRVVRQAGREPECSEPFDVVANTCIEKDVLSVDIPGPVSAGDYLVFDYMGGYTNVLKQPFIHPCQGIWAWQQGQLKPIKRRENASDILASYYF